MAAGTYDIQIDQGATFTKIINITSGGLSYDLTGYVGRSQMRKKVSDTSPSGTFTVTLSGTPTDGVLTMSMSAALTTVLVPGNYIYDLELEKSGNVMRLLEGAAVVKAEVTK